MFKKYGVDNPMKDLSIKEKSISNCKLSNQKIIMLIIIYNEKK